MENKKDTEKEEISSIKSFLIKCAERVKENAEEKRSELSDRAHDFAEIYHDNGRGTWNEAYETFEENYPHLVNRAKKLKDREESCDKFIKRMKRR